MTQNVVSIETIIESKTKLTPMMAQYAEIKKNYQDSILLFRMGDFYEVFFEDAHKASQVLNIALTHRGKIGEYKIPMAGIPHHAANTYIDRLTSAGLRAAICEQVEDPKASKGIVKRAVTQVVSPGMPYDVDRAEANQNQYMVTVCHSRNIFYLALLDYTTGDFIGTTAATELELIEKIALYSPKEVISFLGQWENYPQMENFLKDRSILNTHLSLEHFDPKINHLYIEKLIKNYKKDTVLQETPEVLNAVSALSYYVCSTQKQENYVHIRPFRMEQVEGYLKIGLNTLKGIEIFPKSKETYKDSLLGFFDRAKTSMGSRELKRIFTRPLTDLSKIEQRQNIISTFISDTDLLKEIRESLTGIRDIERVMAKVSNRKANGADLLNLAHAISVYNTLWKKLSSLGPEVHEKLTTNVLKKLTTLAARLSATLNDEIGANLEKGNLIRPGADKKRDRLFKLTQNTAQTIVELENHYKEISGVTKLRIKHNNVFGYFIEISKGQSDKAHKSFVRKQTLVNCERYTTDELSKLEKEILHAKDKLYHLERKIFNDLLADVTALSKELLNLSRSFGKLDTLCALAWVARVEDFYKPEISDNKKILKIEGAWHPLIKNNIQDLFIPHDLELNSDKYFGLITGPNMAGKTTVMREMAIIQFLAQIGSFVPAKKAELGICDYIFSRLGANDDIVNGQSTFMVEMSETASILRHATDKSFIILDEVGRGTSTYDGMSIAWALVEHFANETKALCLFSTHYHELIDLVNDIDSAKNLTVETINHKGEVKFLYRLIEAGASQSFGLYVAKLAGVPKTVLKRSERILRELEKNHKLESNKMDLDQLSLFENQDQTSTIELDLKNLDVMNMTPLEAINKLYQIQSELKH